MLKRLLFFLFMSASLSTAAESHPTASSSRLESLVLGGGCFWCTEATYELVPGVKDVVSGYAGGHVANPTYKQICTGETGHAEVIRIDYDPTAVSLEELLELFWTVHDPTTLNRQGNDVGTQYRSTIMYGNEAQKAAAEKSKAAAQQTLSAPIVTEIVPLPTFYVAEEYHQDYYRNNPNAGYCQFVIKPKVKKLKQALDK